MNTSKTKTFKKGIACAAIAMCLSFLALVGCAANAQESTEPETGEVVLTIDSDDTWTNSSTPVIYHFVNEDADVDFYHATTPETAGEALDLVPGDYTCNVVVPINADGTTYEAVEDTEFTVVAGESLTGTTNLKLVDSPVTAEAADAYLTEFDTIAEHGDDSFTEELVTNVHATIDTVKADLAAKAEAEAKAKAEAEAAAAANATNASNSGNASNKSGSSANSGSSGGGASASSGGGSSKPAQSAPAPSTNSGSSAGSGSSSNSTGHVHEWVTTTVRGETTTTCWCGATQGHKFL